MAQREQHMRMSVEQPLWRALSVYRPLTMVYAVVIFISDYDMFVRPGVAIGYYAVFAVWTVVTWRRVTGAELCPWWFLGADLGMALTGILLTAVAVDHAHVAAGTATLPSIWTSCTVLGYALKGGWRPAALAAALVGVADIAQRGALSRNTVHNVILVWVAAIGIGYVVEVARASERTLARALEIEAATRERERLARDIHDGVLQVLAMVQHRSSTLGGEAAELGRLAGEQEAALRSLITSGSAARRSADGGSPAGLIPRQAADGSHAHRLDEASEGPQDVRTLLARYAGSARVTLSEPGCPVPLEAAAARELAAAVGAALDNVRRHAGEQAHAWILIEDEPDAVVVTVRDDGPGIPEGRLAQAEGEGRLGVALSIKGRLRDIGGTAELISVPGQGTEVELTVPRSAAARQRT